METNLVVAEINLSVNLLLQSDNGTLEITEPTENSIAFTGVFKGRSIKLLFSQSTNSLKDAIVFTTPKIEYTATFYVDNARAFGNFNTDLVTIKDTHQKVKAKIKSEKRFDGTDAYNFLIDNDNL